MTREIAVSFMPAQEGVVTAIYESMKSIGMFYGVGDIGKLPTPGTPEARELIEKEKEQYEAAENDEPSGSDE